MVILGAFVESIGGELGTVQQAETMIDVGTSKTNGLRCGGGKIDDR